MSSARILQGPWLPRRRCDGCGRSFAEGHLIDPVYFRHDPNPYRLCIGCFESDPTTLLSAAQRARRQAGRTA